MKHLYGEFSGKQIADYKKDLHSSVHWLLIYKEQNYEKLDEYIHSLLVRVSGLNDVLLQPAEMVNIIGILQAIRKENAKNDDCDFGLYRKLVFDVHSLIDRIKEG